MKPVKRHFNISSVGIWAPWGSNLVILHDRIIRKIRQKFALPEGTITEVLCPFCKKGHLIVGRVELYKMQDAWGLAGEKIDKYHFSCSTPGCNRPFYWWEDST